MVCLQFDRDLSRMLPAVSLHAPSTLLESWPTSPGVLFAGHILDDIKCICSYTCLMCCWAALRQHACPPGLSSWQGFCNLLLAEGFCGMEAFCRRLHLSILFKDLFIAIHTVDNSRDCCDWQQVSFQRKCNAFSVHQNFGNVFQMFSSKQGFENIIFSKMNAILL